MISVQEEMHNVEWLVAGGMSYELALDLAVRDRRKMMREVKYLATILKAWQEAKS